MEVQFRMDGEQAKQYISPYPFEQPRIGAAAIYCADGRYGEQFDDFLHSQLGLPRYDRVAVPGGPGVLAGHFGAYRDEESLLEQMDFLIRSHDLNRIVLIAHQECGFYLKKLSIRAPEVPARQREDMVKAAARLWSIRSSLVIEAFLAVLTDGLVRFEPMPVRAAAGVC
jgi:hypothetical protein